MSLSWTDLRTLNGSQKEAFEELCCQLAASENVPKGSQFFRKGSPDAGLECYWKLPDGSEWGWQAKFFLSPPGGTQWQQIDDSIKTALEKHPSLIRYIVCLPIDRPDPRIKGRKSFMDKWNQHVKKWKGWAGGRIRPVAFDYWGNHEIMQRLSRNEHQGTVFFWFRKEHFSKEWFEDRLRSAIRDAGPRYTPELNVQLPIVRIFEGLCRTPSFFERLQKLSGGLRSAYSGISSPQPQSISRADLDYLARRVEHLWELLDTARERSVDKIDRDKISEHATKTWEAAWNCADSLDRATEEEKEKRMAETSKENPELLTFSKESEFSHAAHEFRAFAGRLNDFAEFIQGPQCAAANSATLLIAGDAGTGKTHLFCDVAKKRVEAGLPTVLLHGKHFSVSRDPWTQLIDRLSLQGTRTEEFLGALQAAGISAGSRALILIDALNEGDGKTLWSSTLPGMLEHLKRYPWIAIAASVRTSYEDLVVPPHCENLLTREAHQGFAGREYAAAQAFFEHYGIQAPSIPLLIPEFQSPLFLKLLCDGLKNQGLAQLPSGYQGISAIFKLFLDSLNEKLSKPDHLDFDPKARIIDKAVSTVAGLIVEKQRSWLGREEARKVLDDLLPPKGGYSSSLFQNLISEGLLSEERLLDENGTRKEAIQFSYQRFSDHLVAAHILDRHQVSRNPEEDFRTGKALHSLVKDEITCRQNSGLIEAMSVQIPERCRKELTELAPHCAGFQPVRNAFISSFIWRARKAFSKATLKYINQHVLKWSDSFESFHDALLRVASVPDHPYNADRLHKHLFEFSLTDRDAWWSVYLSENYRTGGAIDSLVDWALSASDKSRISDESIQLCATTLTWFLTASYRELRDRATKAIISLLTPRLHLIPAILDKFAEVNDPYVSERLLAAAYGCAMRSADSDAIAKLAQRVYDLIFKRGSPPAHILLRDYARGVIEVALHHGIRLNLDKKKVRPPYKSKWPRRIPTQKKLEKFSKYDLNMSDARWALTHLYDSVMGTGDFARYVIGTNSGFFEWSFRRLGTKQKPTREETYKAFLRSLTERQKRAWKKYKRHSREFCLKSL